MYLTSHWFTSPLLRVNRPSLFCDMAFFNIDLEHPRSNHNPMMLHNYGCGPFHIISNGVNPSIGFRYVPNLTSFWQWASPYGANVQIIMTLHNCRLRQFHRMLNGLNLTSDFEDMRSANFGLHWCRIWFRLSLMGKPICRKWATDHNAAQLQV